MRTKLTMATALAGTLLATCLVSGSAQATSLPVLKGDATPGIVTLVGRGGGHGGGQRGAVATVAGITVAGITVASITVAGITMAAALASITVAGITMAAAVASITPTKAVTIAAAIMAGMACHTALTATVAAADGSIATL